MEQLSQNKESTPLGDLMTIVTACACLDTEFISSNECVKKFENIKNALKSYETLVEIHAITISAMKPIENKLKAFEIIKEKQWFDDFIKEHLNRSYFTQYELDILKEVLK